MAAAACEPQLQPGMVSVIQTFGDRINPHPHVHAVVSRGGWTRDERFVYIPYVDPTAAEKLFRHEVLAFLLREELISPERVELLSSRRNSGFSVHNSVYLPPGDLQAVEALVRYMMRPPVSLARLRLLPAGDQVLHVPKAGGDDPGPPQPERIDAMDYLARVLAQIPPPRKHLVRYHGYYSNAGGTLAARPAQERERIHQGGDGPVGEGPSEDDADQAVLALHDPVLRDGRAQHVPQQHLAAGGVEGTGARGRVKREAVHRGAQRLSYASALRSGGLSLTAH